MSFISTLEQIIEVAEQVAPFVGHGAPEMVALAKDVTKTLDSAKAAFESTNPPKTPRTDQTLAELDEIRATLEAAVNAHVDRTTAALRGE